MPTTQPVQRTVLNTVTHRAYSSGATAYIKVVDVAGGTALATVQTGVETVGLVADPQTHTALLSSTGLTTAVTRFDANGVVSSSALPHGDGPSKRSWSAIR